MINLLIKIGTPWVILADVCYSSAGHKYGTFYYHEHRTIYAIRLLHSSGSLICLTRRSKWGCHIGSMKKFTTLITDADNNILFPDPSIVSKRGRYEYPGYDINDDVLIFKTNEKASIVSKVAEFRIWNGEDFYNSTENDNSARHCIQVSVSFVG